MKVLQRMLKRGGCEGIVGIEEVKSGGCEGIVIEEV